MCSMFLFLFYLFFYNLSKHSVYKFLTGVTPFIDLCVLTSLQGPEANTSMCGYRRRNVTWFGRDVRGGLRCSRSSKEAWEEHAPFKTKTTVSSC